MALYREGKAAMAADGTVTGTGTKWQSSLSLIRPGATIMFLSSPIQMAVVNEVVSDTEIKAITTKGAVVASTDYAILLSDSLTVDGLAQDVAETLRYYQSQETVIADAVDFFKEFDFESLQNLANQIKADSEAAGASATAAAASESAAKTSETNSRASEVAAETARDQVQQIINDAGEQSTLVALAQPTGSSQIGAPGGTVEDFISGRAGFVSSIANARLLTGLQDKQRVNVLGYYDSTPLTGGGTFIADKTDTTTADDGGMTIITSDGTRLKRWRNGITRTVSALSFGCLGDGVFDNTARSQQLITWATNNGFDVEYPAGTFYHSGQVTKPNAFNAPKILGAGGGTESGKRTVLWFDSAIGLKIKGGSGRDCNSGIFDCVLRGKSDNTTVPLQIADQCGFDAVRCRFENAVTACEMYNESTGGFTEFCMLVDCVIGRSCQQTLRMRRGSGNDSFHGSGLVRTVINEMSTSTLSSIQLDAGSLLYNAPLSFTVFKANSNPVIQNNCGHGKTNAKGDINYESGSASRTCNLCSGSSLAYAGSVSALTEGLKMGTAVIAERLQVNSDGSINVQRKIFSYRETIVSGGAITYGYPNNDDAFLIKITVSAANYEYSYLLLVYRNPTDNAGSVTTLATLRTFNSAGYGEPTFSFTTGSGLTITNASYPADGVTVGYTVTQLGTRQNFFMM